MHVLILILGQHLGELLGIEGRRIAGRRNEVERGPDCAPGRTQRTLGATGALSLFFSY